MKFRIWNLATTVSVKITLFAYFASLKVENGQRKIGGVSLKDRTNKFEWRWKRVCTLKEVRFSLERIPGGES